VDIASNQRNTGEFSRFQNKWLFFKLLVVMWCFLELTPMRMLRKLLTLEKLEPVERVGRLLGLIAVDDVDLLLQSFGKTIEVCTLPNTPRARLIALGPSGGDDALGELLSGEVGKRVCMEEGIRSSWMIRG
jgi:hypothetical protein